MKNDALENAFKNVNELASHPDSSLIVFLALDRTKLSPREIAATQAHILKCDSCKRVVDHLTANRARLKAELHTAA